MGQEIHQQDNSHAQKGFFFLEFGPCFRVYTTHYKRHQTVYLWTFLKIQ